MEPDYCLLRCFGLDQVRRWALSSFARLEDESYCKGFRVINYYCSIVCFVLKDLAVSVYKKGDHILALVEVLLSRKTRTRLISSCIKSHAHIKTFHLTFSLLTRYLEYGQTVDMKFLVFVMAALALRVAAAPIEVDTADVADVETLEARQGNWCEHPGITCW